MIYNAIQMREAIDKLIDRVKSPRFNDDRYYEAINQAQKMILNDRVENIKQQTGYSVQTSQRLRNELFSLIPPTYTATITAPNLVSFPPNYFYLLAMENTIDGVKNACRPTTYDEKGLLQRNPFKRTKTNKTYFKENNQGWTIEYPQGSSFTQCLVDYIKLPNIVSIGTESDKIVAGGTVLTLNTSYTFYEEGYHNNVYYYPGQQFNAVNTTLFSGVVIPTSIIVNSDMPENLHDEIVRLSAAIMMGTVDEYNKQSNLIQENKIS